MFLAQILAAKAIRSCEMRSNITNIHFFRVEGTLTAMDRLDANSHRSSALSLDPSLPRSETSSPSVSDRPGSHRSSHEMSDDDAESKSSILRRSPLMGKCAVQHIAGLFQHAFEVDIGLMILPPAGLYSWYVSGCFLLKYC